MRRVDAEGDSRGVRGQQQAESRVKSKLRRAAIEWLERRELLSTSTSTLPSPSVISAPTIASPLSNSVQTPSSVTAPYALTANPSASTPSVTVDPLNANKMVAVWVDHDTAGYNPGGFNVPVTSYLEAAYSTDGGATWTPITAGFGQGGNLNGGGAGGTGGNAYSVNVQLDPSIAPSPSTISVLSQTTDPTIGYDRLGNFYILSSTHNDANSVGVIDLQRFTWSETAGSSPAYAAISQVYSWDAVDGGSSSEEAFTPVLGVDNNLASFTDPTSGTTVTDKYAGNLYAVWAELGTNTYNNGIPNFNPNTIRMTASSNEGASWTHAAYVDNSSNANGYNSGVASNPPQNNYPLHDSNARYAEPSISISQGNGSTVPGGQVTIVYDDYGTVAPLDQILDQTVQDGGTSNQFVFNNQTGANPAGIIPNNNSTAGVTIPINVSLPSNFSLQNLDVTLQVAYPSMANFGATLVPPAGSGLSSITLFRGDVASETGTPDGTADLGFTTYAASTLGTLEGIPSPPPYRLAATMGGTVFDAEAIHPIRDGKISSHAVGHYQPDGEAALLALQGKTGTALSGVWHLVINIITADSSTTDTDFVSLVNLNFGQGNDPGGDGDGETLIAGKTTTYVVPIPNINPDNSASAYSEVVHSLARDNVVGDNVSGSGNTTAPTQAAAILPAPVVASDNTLGSFNSHQGRLYVAFTGKLTGSAAGDTDIFLAYSDDGGLSWSVAQQVNDDNGATDGYSGASAGASGNVVGSAGITGRAQYEPQIAVDNSTGDVVLSFLDARNDPSNARVATYIAVSENGATLNSDGTSGFAADVYANPSETAINAINAPGSDTVNLGPIPDNQSSTGGVQTTFGYGTRQSLVVTNGRIVPFWASNENKAVNMQIVDSVMSLTAGPQIISSTEGPVGLPGDTVNPSGASSTNASVSNRDASGTTLANTIDITFDRVIDPTSYAAGVSSPLGQDVFVYYESPAGGSKILLPIIAVIPLNASGNQGATKFAITFDPTNLTNPSSPLYSPYGYVGTYSYKVEPTGIISQNRTVNAPVVTTGDSGFLAPAGTSATNTSPQGIATTTVTVSGQTSQYFPASPSVAGTFTGTITLIEPTTTPAASAATDYAVTIFAPGGQAVTLAAGTATFVDNGNGTTTTTITYNAAQFTVPFAQTVPLNGTYRLQVIASNGSTETITINAGWQLRLNGVTVTPSINRGSVMDQDGSGISGQRYNDAYLIGQPITTQTLTYANTTASAIPANGQVVSQIPVIDDYQLLADNGVLPGVVLTVNATFPTNNTLSAYLVAPDGTMYSLFLDQTVEGVYQGITGANLATTFSDLAATSIIGSNANGTFKPLTSFNSLTSPVDYSSLGTWELLIQNAGASTGTLNNWSLTFQPPQATYQTGTLPLIVPGPHVTSVTPVDPTTHASIVSAGSTNNLVLDNNVSYLEVTFDRNIQVSSFTAAQVLSLFGPAGAVSLAGLGNPVPLYVYSASPSPLGSQAAYTSGGVADIFLIAIPTQQISGTYTITLGTGIVAADSAVVSSSTQTAVQAGVDANTNAGLDVLRGTATNGVTVPVTYASTAVPATITPATVNSGGGVTASVLSAPINVPVDFPIQADDLAAGISSLTLTLNITYPTDPDLVAYLVAPGGQKVKLFTNIGAGSNTANFSNTTFSDTASTSIDKAAPPYFGTFTPEQPFSNFGPGTGNDNLDSGGAWTLEILNSGNSSGTLNSWSLTFQKPVSSTGLSETPDDQSHASFQIFNLAATNALANQTWTAVGPTGITTSGATKPVTFSNASVSAITAGSSASPTTLTSSIIIPNTVADNFAILPDSSTFTGVTLSLNITYPTNPTNPNTIGDSNLSAYLLAPDGTTKIPLFASVGGSGINFGTTSPVGSTNPAIYTTFSDLGTSSINSGSAPFAGTYQPASSLNQLSTNGLYTNGTWKLVITNTGAQAGTLNGWSMTFQEKTATLAGTVSSIAVDPSDTTGNTVFVGSSSGGVWKTTDFLTTAPGGPTYVPLTDNGPSFAQNIGALAVFGRNNDPAQTIVFAGTGFAQEGTITTGGTPNVDLNSGTGDGIIRSTDGGQTWQVLGGVTGSVYKIVVDPMATSSGAAIVYAATTTGLWRSLDSGNDWTQLAAGNATDVLLDPNSGSPTTHNLDTLYVAFSNVSGWLTGAVNYPEPAGIYYSVNQGQTLQPLNGQLGKDPLLVTPGFPATPLQVATTPTPNNVNSAYIVLAKPALTGNIAENLAYQGWLYAAVENYNGTFQGLYVTKDAGENWTLVQLPNIAGNGPDKAAIPTNATNAAASSYDPTSSTYSKQGAYDLTLTVDPTDPNIVYIGGSENFQGSGMIRVDLTTLYDAHNLTSGSNDRSDGGALFVQGQGGVTAPALASNGVPATYLNTPQYLNLRYAPNDGGAGTSPFNINATLVIANAGPFINDGTGATWTLFDEPLRVNAGDLTSTTNLHSVIDYVDPITGAVRLIFADDSGVFSTLVNQDGTMDNGIGSYAEPTYSRNGNLQDEALLDSAAQPSASAAAGAGAEFYTSGTSILAAQSDANVLTNGNLTWDDSGVLNNSGSRNTTANSAINSSDRSGVGVATDSTGSSAIYEYDIPILGGNLTDFFRVNGFGQTTGLDANVNTDFPANGSPGDAHEGGVAVVPVTNSPNTVNDAQIVDSNFEVNPLNGNQILIASATGNLYETTNQGLLWIPIGTAADFGADAAIIDAIDGGKFSGDAGRSTPLPIQIAAIAYGAPDPNVVGGVGNLNNFIYVGTTGNNYEDPDSANRNANPPDTYRDADGLYYNDAHIYVTQAGGQGWTDISKGLDGSSVVAIYPDPNRGSHAAYAVTKTGIFYSPDTTGLAAAGLTVWTNITSNLESLTYDAFGNPAYQQSVLAPYSYSPVNEIIPGPTATANLAPPVPYNPVFNSQYGGFTDIVADYRYQIPAPTNATDGTSIFYPVLYASGYGGVFRSIDNGVTWTVFPNESFDNAPVDGGYLPNVDVTSLTLALGNINPDTGHPVQSTGDPEVLLATTYGRGDFAIRLAPDVIPTSVAFDTTEPAPNGSDSSGVGITNTLYPYLDGVSEVSNFGNNVAIKLYDERPGANFGKLLSDPGTFTMVVNGVTETLPINTTNALGQFVHWDPTSQSYLPGIQLIDYNNADPNFFIDSTALDDKIVGIQATDSAGASGNMTLFRYTLATTPPYQPNPPMLEATYDTGRSTTDGLTDLSVPAQAGPGASLTIVTPVFDVSTPLVNGQQANPLTPNPISLTVELLRGTSPNGPFTVIDSSQTGFTNAGNTLVTYMLTDPGLAALAATGIDETFYYEALQIDEAGNVSTPASNVTAITVDTIAPAAPTGLTLITPVTGTPPMPTYSVTGILPGDQVLLYRSIGGGTPILVGTGGINNSNVPATLSVTDTTGASPDGVYTYYAVQLDIYGNYSPLSAGVQEVINTQTPPAAPILESKYDTGRSSTDDVTNIEIPAPTPGSTPSYVAPVFDVTTVPPAAGQPPITTVELYRATNAAGPFSLVASTPFTGNPAMLTDNTLAALASAGQINANGQKFYYESDQINAAGITSAKSPTLTITVNTTIPATLPAPMLDAGSNSGLNKSQLITNVTKPYIDYANLLPGEQVFLYRSTGGAAPILVGTGPINTTGASMSGKIQDTTGATPDGVYQYYVVQQDLAGNISNYSQAVTVTINTTAPPKPTIALLASDDTGLPSHPNVTSVNTPHFIGTAQYNAGTNFPVYIANVATGAIYAMTYPAANGTYLAQITTPLADGVYTLTALSENLAGTFSYSTPITITIKHTGPQTPPNLMLLPADDTGIKGDGVTSNHNPRFTGTTDPGDTVSLYVLSNGNLLGPEATTTSSTVNGSFTFQLPFSLTDGTTQLVAQTSDIAGNKGTFSSPYTFRVSTTTGDYLASGAAQLTLFNPYTETYYVRLNATTTVTVPVDSTPGRDVPVQYDFNGDGVTDLAAFRYNTAEFFGYVSNNSTIDQQYGVGGASLPVSGYYGTTGTYINAIYIPSSATWALSLPQPGGLVVHFGVPGIDIPAPAAYNGYGSTEIAVFRGTTVMGGDADSFTVIGPTGQYMVSFTSAAVAKLGFVYKAGDIPAPADYDGVGRDEFAVYRPSTGQFFILNTPSYTNTATWTLRTVTLNLPGGAKAGDVPVSQDYDGVGMANPTVYRPSNSTFYMIHAVTGTQSNIQFQPFASTVANQFIAAGGPILYRLQALLGIYATNGGYGGTGATGGGLSIGVPGASTVHAAAIATPSATTTTVTASPSATTSLTTTVMATTPIATAPTPATPTPTTLALSATPSIPVTVGVTTPAASSAVVVGPKVATKSTTSKKVTKPTVEAAAHKVETKPAAAKPKAHVAPAAEKPQATTAAKATSAKAAAKSHTTLGALATAALQHLVMATKGRKKG